MKKLIFKFFLFFFFFSNVYANNISFHYEKIKNQIKTNELVESGDYFFSGSFSKYSSIESIDIEKNKIEAIKNLVDFLSKSVDWPQTFSEFEKKKKWLAYKSKRKVNLIGVKIVDNGKIGNNYFVIVGIKRETLFKNKVTFDKLEEIINK
ncbi:MAG: hypothetical protein CL572_05305 [Alphaproteobacteria bacterium]|nr:hypothetical protein [Alphaproteobacteria bacterium]